MSQHEQEGSVAVTVDADCAWTAVSQASWIHVTSGASGTGTSVVRYRIERLPGGPEGERTGTIQIGTETFTIIQRRGGGE